VETENSVLKGYLNIENISGRTPHIACQDIFATLVKHNLVTALAMAAKLEIDGKYEQISDEKLAEYIVDNNLDADMIFREAEKTFQEMAKEWDGNQEEALAAAIGAAIEALEEQAMRRAEEQRKIDAWKKADESKKLEAGKPEAKEDGSGDEDDAAKRAIAERAAEEKARYEREEARQKASKAKKKAKNERERGKAQAVSRHGLRTHSAQDEDEDIARMLNDGRHLF
jgi:colicin import membrane protein